MLNIINPSFARAEHAADGTIGYIACADWAKRWLCDANALPSPFDVDVNVELRGDKPVAYRIVQVHDVIDLPQ